MAAASTYRVRLKGPALGEGRIPGEVLADLLAVFAEGVPRATRLRVEGRSTAPGPAPTWLSDPGWSVLAEDPRAGIPASMGTRVADSRTPYPWNAAHTAHLTVEARPLGASLPADLRPLLQLLDIERRTAFDLFLESLADAAAGREHGELLDLPLLATVEHLGKVFRRGVETLSFAGGRSLEVDPESIETARRLRRQTPPPQAAMVAGRLDLLRHSDRLFTLLLEDGRQIRCVFVGPPGEAAALAALWGQRVRVSGRVGFRPSGEPLRVEAEVVVPATPDDLSLWSRMPRPILGRLDVESLRVPQGPGTGINAIFGKLAGIGSDEDFYRALDELS